jgi:hypothetical protein
LHDFGTWSQNSFDIFSINKSMSLTLKNLDFGMYVTEHVSNDHVQFFKPSNKKNDNYHFLYICSYIPCTMLRGNQLLEMSTRRWICGSAHKEINQRSKPKITWTFQSQQWVILTLDPPVCNRCFLNKSWVVPIKSCKILNLSAKWIIDSIWAIKSGDC